MLKTDHNPRGPIAELLPRHNEIHWLQRLLEIVSIGTAVTLLCCQLVRLVMDSNVRFLWMLPVVLFGFIMADFLSGMIHWTADTWFRDTMPVLGQRLLKPFRVHHVNPDDFLRRNVIDTNGDVAAIVTPFLIGAFWIPTTTSFSAALTVCLVSFCAAGLPTNQVHQWAHMRHPPMLIRGLQSLGIVLSRAAHQQHHRTPFVRNYCIALGWCNPVFTALDFFPRLERIITRLTGFEPRNDDQKFQAECAGEICTATGSDPEANTRVSSNGHSEAALSRLETSAARQHESVESGDLDA